MIGQHVGNYRIESLLGSGGMGQVYRALDSRLGRAVAIKVLSPEVMSDPARRRRFTLEARAASALNHPNIVHIYDICEQDGLLYMVMELVQGQTLKQMIRGGGLPLHEVLRLGEQLADALAAAHGANLIHRDIKPANLIVTPQGLLKLVDFGIAKVTARDDGTTTNADTRTDLDLTREGAVVGEAAYMSPEEVRGKKSGAPSDVFSLGALLYEMITGQRAFSGENSFAVLSAVVAGEPAPMERFLRDPPAAPRHIIEQCLRKDPEQRPTAAQVRDGLSRLLSAAEAGLTARSRDAVPHPNAKAEPRRTHGRMRLAVGAAGLAATAAGLTWLLAGSRIAPREAPRLTRLTADGGLTTDGVLSPDGRLLAFASNRGGDGNLDIWVRPLDGGEPVRLTVDPAAETDPAFSPDGRWIAFRSENGGGGVDIVPVAGDRRPRRIAEGGRGPRYSPDGKWIACWVGERQSDSAIFLTPADGSGAPRELKLHPRLPVARYPTWSPDGKQLIFLGQGEDRHHDWWVASTANGEARATGAFTALRDARILVSYQTAPGDWAASHEVYFTAHAASEKDPLQAREYDYSVSNFDSTNLWKIPIDPGTAKAARLPTRLTVGAAVQLKPSVGKDRIVFSGVNERINLWTLDLPERAGQPRMTPIAEDTASNTYPALSLNGRFVAYSSNRGADSDLWLRDLTNGKEKQLTFDRGDESGATISANGSRVAYSIQFGDSTSIRTLDLDAEGNPGAQREICKNCDYLSQISPDGSSVLIYQRPPDGVLSFDVATGRRQLLLKTPRYAVDPQVSPNGNWLAFHTIDGKTIRRVWVAPLGRLPIEEADWIPVTEGKGMDRHPAWSADGTAIYFHSESDGWRCVWSRGFDPKSGRVAGTAPEPVAHFHSASRNMLHFPNAAMARLGVGRGRMVFSLYERTGNVWLADWSR